MAHIIIKVVALGLNFYKYLSQIRSDLNNELITDKYLEFEFPKKNQYSNSHGKKIIRYCRLNYHKT